jgi:TonB family protein
MRHNPPTCDGFFAPGTRVPQDAGTTLVSFRLTTGGEMRDVAVFRSSGNSDLDQAGVACIGAIPASPLRAATVAGKPIEITWVAGVFWNSPVHTAAWVTSDGKPNICDRGVFRGLGRIRAAGVTRLSYRIATDGGVKDVVVTVPSGNPQLDKAALSCASEWHFFPATHDGKPVEFDEKTQIVWRAH